MGDFNLMDDRRIPQTTAQLKYYWLPNFALFNPISVTKAPLCSSAVYARVVEAYCSFTKQ